MTFRRLVTLLLIGLMAVLVPAAHASPPDQTWLGGFYDNADYDDAVVSITSSVVTAETNLPCDLEPTRIVVGSLSTNQSPLPAATAPAPRHSRAPPAS